MEEIILIVIKRIVNRRAYIRKFKGEFGPKIWKKIEESTEENVSYKLDWNREDGFEINQGRDDKYVVNFEQSTCTYRKCDLTSVPYAQAMNIILTKKWKIEDYISYYYKNETFQSFC